MSDRSPTSAVEVRNRFTNFYADLGHTPVKYARIVPADPTMLFTIAGMVQFKDFFTGKSKPDFKRATTIQPCVRTVDIDIIGSTDRHLTLFEMLGNFSFGDYFKRQAIEWAWTFYSGELGIDPDRLWITVHEDDDEAETIWQQDIGISSDKIQRMDEDNFWKMGEIGPCGPCSELYFDRGESYGPGGGPKFGGAERYIEIGNLVFMQFERTVPGGPMTDLPSPCVDFGGGLERVLAVVQDAGSVFETDLFRPLIEHCLKVSSCTGSSEELVKLKIMADHARAISFIIPEGVVPSNEGRGYVLRRLIRRTILKSAQLGITSQVMPELTHAVVENLGSAYPHLIKHKDLISKIVSREEEIFRKTLRSGNQILEDHLSEIQESGEIDGEVAFLLHDTHGFPIELTEELAQERGFSVDRSGFEEQMTQQRRRARTATKVTQLKDATMENALVGEYRSLIDRYGPTEFIGYEQLECESEIIDITRHESSYVDIFTRYTPFYGESGGQQGDQGIIRTDSGVVKVIDTDFALPGLIRHIGIVESGEVGLGQVCNLFVDAARRDSLRRNHTSTHLLHWGLRQVLGHHVHQQGSLVTPERLRFDFSHYEGVAQEQLDQVEEMVNNQIVSNSQVETFETSMSHATELGAMAFFGDKYGDVVRVVKASDSIELCGGTHVDWLGMIGPIKIVSESSIGSGIRRIEAISGQVSLNYIREVFDRLEFVTKVLKVVPTQVPEALERLLLRLESIEAELKMLKRKQLDSLAKELVLTTQEGVVVSRLDGKTPDELRELAVILRGFTKVEVVVLGSKQAPGKVSLVSAVPKGSTRIASQIIAEAAQLLGGGVGKGVDLAVAGGRHDNQLDQALERAREAALNLK